MIKINNALISLGLTDYALFGEPTNESEFNTMFKKVTGTNSDGSSILSSNTSNFGVTWAQVKTEYDSLVSGEALSELRKERNNKLKDTDFYALSDVTMSSEMTTYRQALRDLPSNYTTSDGEALTDNLSNLNWPTKP